MNGGAGILGSLPPRLEDAGLEDCALPAHSIEEAFHRAADALHNVQLHVRSTTTGILKSMGSEEEFSDDARPGDTLWQDLHLAPFYSQPMGSEESCVDMKTGGLVEQGHDLVVAPGPHFGESDKVVFGKESGPKLGDQPCVEGLAGDKGEKKNSPGEAKERPILVLA